MGLTEKGPDAMNGLYRPVSRTAAHSVPQLYVPGASDGEEPQRHGEERDNRVPVCQVWVKNAMIAYLMIHGHVRSWPESQECNRGTAQSGSHKEMQ